MHQLMEQHRPDALIHLAAQAGVRYYDRSPRKLCRGQPHRHVPRARGDCAPFPRATAFWPPPPRSTAANTEMPYCRDRQRPTRRCRSMPPRRRRPRRWPIRMRISTICRPPCSASSTVYGPWGRPDMAPYKFHPVRILAGDPIDVYNHGDMSRDFYLYRRPRRWHRPADRRGAGPACARRRDPRRRQPVASRALPDREYRQLRTRPPDGFHRRHRGRRRAAPRRRPSWTCNPGTSPRHGPTRRFCNP